MKLRVITIDEVLSAGECSELIEYLRLNLASVPSMRHTNSSFDGREIDYSRVTSKSVRAIMDRVRRFVAAVGSDALELELLYPEFTDLVVWPAGSSLPHHTDDKLFPQRKVSAVCYLNDDFKGGETRFDTEGTRATVRNGPPRINPRRGRLVMYPSGIRHWVTPIKRRSPTRYTLALWATDDIINFKEIESA